MTGDSNSVDYSSLPLDFLNLAKEDQELLATITMSLGLALAEPRLQVCSFLMSWNQEILIICSNKVLHEFRLELNTIGLPIGVRLEFTRFQIQQSDDWNMDIQRRANNATQFSRGERLNNNLKCDMQHD